MACLSNGTAHHIYDASVLEIVLYAAVLVTGGIGNYLVVSVILLCKSIKQSAPFNLYLLALAVVDLILSVLLLPLYVAKSSYVMSDSLYESLSVTQGDIICKALASDYPLFWLGIVESYILVLICVERRIAIVKPFSTLTRRYYIHPIGIVTLLVLAGGIVELPTMYGLKYNRNPQIPNFCIYIYDQSTASLLYTAVAIIEYAIPLFIFIVCFNEVYKKLHELENSLMKGNLLTCSSRKTPSVALIRHGRKRTIDTMKWVILVFLLCVTPNTVLYVVFQYLKRENETWESSLYQFAIVLRFTHACFNPILYCFVSREFRRHLVQVYPRLSSFIKSSTAYLLCRRCRPYRRNSRLHKNSYALSSRIINISM